MATEDDFKTIDQIIYQVAAKQVYDQLKTNQDGLSSEEAKERLQQFGKNTIKEKQGRPLYLQFLSNFISMMAILLWISGGIAFVAKMPELGVAVWCVNIINGIFSFI